MTILASNDTLIARSDMTREELLAGYKEEARDFAKEVLRFQEELDAKFFDSWAEHLFNLAEKLQPALPEGLEEAAERYADMNCHNYIDHESDRNELFYSFKAGANWRAMHSSKLPDNLNQAAEEYAYTNWEDNDYHEGASEGLPFDAIGHTEKCFIAGVEWQRKKDQQLIELAEDHAMLAGMNKMKEEMMEKAVEAEVNTYEDLAAGKSWAEFVVEMPTNSLGDKVKIIVIKEEK